jgi:hypothetical protein
MGIRFRFRRSLRIAPGLRVNLAKRSMSISVGRPGATLNIGPRGERTTVGIPGTGLSYTSTASKRRDSGIFWVAAVLILAGAIVALIRTKI